MNASFNLAEDIVCPNIEWVNNFFLLREVPTSLEGQIVIGTPGTVQDWAFRYRAIDLKKINVFVLDEADVMIDTQGHQDQSVRIQR